MYKKIRWKALQGALVAALLVAGIGQTGQAEMRIAWQSADVQTLLSLADKTGIFEDEGLEYSLRSFPSGGTILPAMAAKEVDIGWMGEFAALTGFTNGIPLEVIMVEQDWPSYLRVIVQPESGITDITELKGAKIGMAFGSSGHNHALLMLDRAGLSASDVTLINLQPAQLPAAMLAKQVDVAVIWETNAGLIERQGGIPIATTESLGAWLIGIWIARKEYVRDNPEEIQKFLRGWSRAMKRLNDQCQESLQFEAERIGQTPEELSGLLVRAGTKWPSWGSLISDEYMGAPGKVETSRLYEHYLNLAHFMVGLERLKAVPENLADVINPQPIATYLEAHPEDANNGPTCPK